MSLPSTIQTTVKTSLSTVETPTAAQAPAAGTKQVVNNGFDQSVSYGATSTPPGQVASYQTFALTASGTLDLTALKTLFQASVDCTGMKLRALLINNLDPTNVFTIQAGAANPYAIGGNQIKVQPLGTVEMDFVDGLAVVGAGAKNLDWTANVATGNAQITLILG